MQRPPFARRAVGVLRELFPEPAEPGPRLEPRAMFVLLAVAVIPLGVLVMLVRVAGTAVPAWDSIYGEDLSIYLVQALQHPWPVLASYAGYLQLVPRLMAQFVVYLPLRDAAAAFAVSGALVTTGCALFIFSASAGHVRSAGLRVVLALAVVLLPVAQLEIADSDVNCPWYLLFALFWAALWRPRTRAGMAGAAAIGFFTAASTTVSVVFAPLLLARVIALPRLREHAVTAGWAARLPAAGSLRGEQLGQRRPIPGGSPGLTGTSARLLRARSGAARTRLASVLAAAGFRRAKRRHADYRRHPGGLLRPGSAHPARAGPGVRGGRPDHRFPGRRARRDPEVRGDDLAGRGEL